MSYVSIEGLRKSYSGVDVLKGIDLTIERGQFTVLLGPSGCGKSTTLRLFAGLDSVSGGAIHIDGRDVTRLEPRERDISMVFQNYALYPTMTVEQNMGFGLKARKLPAGEIRQKVHAAAEMLGISALLDRRPRALSGGQQQRVAIGRAIVREPKVFLFDEPLSNLDAKLRVDMRTEILRLHRTLGSTTIYVTHDQEEAMTMADQIVIMNAGLIEQIGAPEDIYFKPATVMVAGFIGSPAMGFVTGTAQADGRVETPLGNIRTDQSLTQGQVVQVGLRPDDIQVAGGASLPDEAVTFEAEIALTEMLGPRAILHLRHGNGPDLKAVISHEVLVQLGGRTDASFRIRKKALHLFDAQSGKRVSP